MQNAVYVFKKICTVMYRSDLWVETPSNKGSIENQPLPNPDKPELKIEDCKLNICGCRFAPPLF